MSKLKDKDNKEELQKKEFWKRYDIIVRDMFGIKEKEKEKKMVDYQNHSYAIMRCAIQFLTSHYPAHERLWLEYEQKEWIQPRDYQLSSLYERVMKLYPCMLSEECFDPMVVKETPKDPLSKLELTYRYLLGKIRSCFSYNISEGHEMIHMSAEEAYDASDRVYNYSQHRKRDIFEIFVDGIVTPIYHVGGKQPQLLDGLLRKYVFVPAPMCMECKHVQTDKERGYAYFERCPTCHEIICSSSLSNNPCRNIHQKKHQTSTTK
jgi:hypothetical protein